MGAGRGRGGLGGAMKAAASVGCCALVITAAVLIGVSFSVLEPNEVGLDFDGIAMEVNTDRVYESGTWFLGLAHRFIKYPRTQQTIKYASNDGGADGPPITARTQDGLPITISFAFNYNLRTTMDQLLWLYLHYGEMDAVDIAYNRMARNVVRSVTSGYTAFQFFSIRSTIQAEMQAALNADLAKAGASVEALQLLDIGLPARFNDARTRQESALQAVSQAINDRAVASINARTAVDRASAEAELIVEAARTQAQSLALSNAAAIDGLVARYTSDRESYAVLKDRLNMTTRELLAFIWMDGLAEAGVSASVRPLVHLPVPQGLTQAGDGA